MISANHGRHPPCVQQKQLTHAVLSLLSLKALCIHICPRGSFVTVQTSALFDSRTEMIRRYTGLAVKTGFVGGFLLKFSSNPNPTGKCSIKC